MKRKILVILAHPAPASYCGALATAYAQGAGESRAEVRQLVLADLKFNPVHAGGGQVEADIIQARDAIMWAEHLVFVYPILWGTIPALLKGFIERTFVPGFAVNFSEGSRLWDRLLKGRSARLIVTMNSAPFIYRWVFGEPAHKTMKRAILKFCGVSPVRITAIGPMRAASKERREAWLENVRKAGRALA
ncbi:MAG: NAD(P)H-dependent oxidoreductase [Acidiferrobacterales bacterium]